MLCSESPGAPAHWLPRSLPLGNRQSAVPHKVQPLARRGTPLLSFSVLSLSPKKGEKLGRRVSRNKPLGLRRSSRYGEMTAFRDINSALLRLAHSGRHTQRG